MRCDALLGRGGCDPGQVPLALALTALCLFLLTATAPMLGINVLGQTRTFDMPSAPLALQAQGMWELGVVVAATTLALPALRIIGLVAVLAGLRQPVPARWVGTMFGVLERVTPWAMLEVFLLGGFVAYTRVQAVAQVSIGNAAYALGGLMLVAVALDASLDPGTVWRRLPLRRPTGLSAADHDRAISCHTCGLVQAPVRPRCARCGERLQHRKPHSLARAAALTLAATLFYIPANLYPMMTITYLGRTTPYTVLGGVQELLQSGMWPLALVVFLASVAVPVLKLGVLAWIMLATRRRSGRGLVQRTRAYRAIDFIGRWSMIDVFMLSILVALLRFGLLSSVTPGTGAVAFAGVVVLTMLATETFDPRLMWDAAGRNPSRA